MLSALISAFGSASGLILDKFILSRKKVPLRVYLPLSFIFLFAFSLILTPFYGYINWEVARLSNTMMLLFLMIVIAIAWNVLYAQSMQKEKLHEHELITMMTPLVTILLAAAFFPEEFDYRVFVLAVVASLALIFARTEKAHFKLDTVGYNLMLAVVLMATESIIMRELLFWYSPIALYTIRTLFITLFFAGFYKPKYQQVPVKTWWLISLSALFGFASMVGRLFAFNSLGIIHATLITSLAPMVVFFASWEILHERIRPRVVVGALVILVAVGWATVLSF